MNRLEGFWWSKEEQGFPVPQPYNGPWSAKPLFLEALEKVESKAQSKSFKGWSKCRLCSKSNGSESFIYKGWEWPSGYRHYIEVHGVRPSVAFEQFILGSTWGRIFAAAKSL